MGRKEAAHHLGCCQAPPRLYLGSARVVSVSHWLCLQAVYPNGIEVYCEQISHHPPISSWQVYEPEGKVRRGAWERGERGAEGLGGFQVKGSGEGEGEMEEEVRRVKG